MSAIVVNVPERHVLVKGPRQYDFVPQDGDVVVIVSTGPRYSLRGEVSTVEARQLWQRLKSIGYEEW